MGRIQNKRPNFATFCNSLRYLAVGAKSETFAQHPRNNDICYKEQFVERGIGVGTDCKSARSGVSSIRKVS